MLSDITTEMQQLIRNRTKLQTYVLLLVLFDKQRMFQQGVPVSDPFTVQQQRVV